MLFRTFRNTKVEKWNTKERAVNSGKIEVMKFVDKHKYTVWPTTKPHTSQTTYSRKISEYRYVSVQYWAFDKPPSSVFRWPTNSVSNTIETYRILDSQQSDITLMFLDSDRKEEWILILQWCALFFISNLSIVIIFWDSKYSLIYNS